jgi:hypothetical protein
LSKELKAHLRDVNTINSDDRSSKKDKECGSGRRGKNSDF